MAVNAPKIKNPKHFENSLLVNRKAEKDLEQKLYELGTKSKQRMMELDIERHSMENQMKIDQRNNTLLQKRKTSIVPSEKMLQSRNTAVENPTLDKFRRVARVIPKLLIAISTNENENQEKSVATPKGSFVMKKEEKISSEPNMAKTVNLTKNVRKEHDTVVNSHQFNDSGTKLTSKEMLQEQEQKDSASDTITAGASKSRRVSLPPFSGGAPAPTDKNKRRYTIAAPCEINCGNSSESIIDDEQLKKFDLEAERKLITLKKLSEEQERFDVIQKKINTFLHSIGPAPSAY